MTNPNSQFPIPNSRFAPPPTAPVHWWLCGPIEPAARDAISRLARTPEINHIAVMPDVHVATEFCVGTVIAAAETLFPMAVGGDIGCGMLALRFDAPAEILRDRQRAANLLAALYEVCPARRHHRNLAPPMPPDLAAAECSHPPLTALLRTEARLQLGTLGSGNHFLELQSDAADNSLWLMLHTGSRNLGQMVLQHHLPACRKTSTNLFALPADSPAGRAYLHDVNIARQYAAANRAALAHAAAGALEQLFHIAPQPETLINCDHNHVQQETVQQESRTPQPMFVHRKGATLAAADSPGIIPGSMAGPSFHTLGRGNALALNSSSHGAGRLLSRTQAREKISASQLKSQLQNIWYDHRLSPHLREESPVAYKPIREVMQAQSDLTRITRTLMPLLCYKGV